MSYIDEALTHPVPILSSVESQILSDKELQATTGEDNKVAEQPLENADDSDQDFILVDFEEDDPHNPLNWSQTQKWSIVFAISWMGFVR